MKLVLEFERAFVYCFAFANGSISVNTVGISDWIVVHGASSYASQPSVVVSISHLGPRTLYQIVCTTQALNKKSLDDDAVLMHTRKV